MTDLAHGEPLIAPERRLMYGDAQLAYEPPAVLEGHLDGRTKWTIALAIFAPVVAAYGAIAYGLYQAADAIL